MPDHLNPGVSIGEIDRGPKPIEGVPTSTAAFIGETERGPTKPRLVTSYREYERWFGGVFGDTRFMPYAVTGFFENGGNRLYVCRVTDDSATAAEAVVGNFTVRAVGPGFWGTRVDFRIMDGSTKKAGTNGKPVAAGFRLLLAYFSAQPTSKDLEWFNDSNSSPQPAYCEIFDDLETVASSPNYWSTRLLGNSALVELTLKDSAPATERPPNIAATQLSANGVDGAANLDVADFEGKDTPPRAKPQGLAALELDSYRDVALVYAPGASIEVSKKVIEHCERLRFRFTVVDPDRNVNITDFLPRSEITDTKYAALYYPWIGISDPKTGDRRVVPPGGHVLGVLTRRSSSLPLGPSASRRAEAAPTNQAASTRNRYTARVSSGAHLWPKSDPSVGNRCARSPQRQLRQPPHSNHMPSQDS